MNIKKTAVVIAAIVLSATLARATLIDLTPGGFDLTQPFPIVVQRFFGQYGPNGLQNIAGANIVNGHVIWSPFTLFGDDHFDLTLNDPSGTSGTVGWDLNGTGYHLRYVFAESTSFIGHLYGHLYAVPGLERFAGDGFVEIADEIPLLAVTFTGSNTVPDTGSTLAMLSIAIGILGLYRRVQA